MQDGLDDKTLFLSIQNHLLDELSKLLPEGERESFLIFWIDNHASQLREVFIWIEQHNKSSHEDCN